MTGETFLITLLTSCAPEVIEYCVLTWEMKDLTQSSKNLSSTEKQIFCLYDLVPDVMARTVWCVVEQGKLPPFKLKLMVLDFSNFQYIISFAKILWLCQQNQPSDRVLQSFCVPDILLHETHF